MIINIALLIYENKWVTYFLGYSNLSNLILNQNREHFINKWWIKNIALVMLAIVVKYKQLFRMFNNMYKSFQINQLIERFLQLKICIS